MKKFLLIIILLMTSTAAVEKPQLVLLSNDIDFELNQELIGFLRERFDVVRSPAQDFTNHKQALRILILGGPEAKDVGRFAGEVLAPAWQDELRKKKGEKNIYIESSKWTEAQVVLVVAGNNRYDTQAVAQQEKERIIDLLNSLKPFSKISPEELKNKMNSGALFTLLDVRSQSEFDAGHIKNAVNIPFPELQMRYAELDKNKEIVTYCQSGKVGALAAQYLINRGFVKVLNLLGGMDAWKEKFGVFGIEATTKATEVKEGVFNLKEGEFVDANGVRISFYYVAGPCATTEEHILSFVKLENGKEVGNAFYVVAQGHLGKEDITEDLHAKGFLLGYTIKVPTWGYITTVSILPSG